MLLAGAVSCGHVLDCFRWQMHFSSSVGQDAAQGRDPARVCQVAVEICRQTDVSFSVRCAPSYNVRGYQGSVA